MVFNSLNNEYFFKITFIKLLGSCIDFLQTPGRLLLYFKDYWSILKSKEIDHFYLKKCIFSISKLKVEPVYEVKLVDLSYL